MTIPKEIDIEIVLQNGLKNNQVGAKHDLLFVVSYSPAKLQQDPGYSCAIC